MDEHGFGVDPRGRGVTRSACVAAANVGHVRVWLPKRRFMSRSTVKTHLSHIYAKLDVANRTELAAVAAAHLKPDPTPRLASDLTIDPSGRS